jgi:hypothetical protein
VQGGRGRASNGAERGDQGKAGAADKTGRRRRLDRVDTDSI